MRPASAVSQSCLCIENMNEIGEEKKNSSSSQEQDM
jgi:hypothetical protein